jgi:hypothetical protein
MNDPILDLVVRLPSASVPPDRARDVRERCRRVLERRARGRVAGRRVWRPVWSGATIGLAAIYLAEALRQVWALGVR